MKYLYAMKLTIEVSENIYYSYLKALLLGLHIKIQEHSHEKIENPDFAGTWTGNESAEDLEKAIRADRRFNREIDSL